MTWRSSNGFHTVCTATAYPLIRWSSATLTILLVGLVFSIAAPVLHAEDAPSPGLDHSHAGQMAPDAPFVDEQGKIRYLSDFRGQTLLVTFWATWCYGCIIELPTLERLQAEGRDQVIVIPIIHDKGGIRTAENYFFSHNLNFLRPFAETDARDSLGAAFGQKWLPTSIVIDSQGREIARATGILDWNKPDIRRIFDR